MQQNRGVCGLDVEEHGSALSQLQALHRSRARPVSLVHNVPIIDVSTAFHVVLADTTQQAASPSSGSRSSTWQGLYEPHLYC
jgi:hypothetical protein